MRNYKLYASVCAVVLVVLVAVGFGVNAFMGNTKVVVEGDYIEAPAVEGEMELGAMPGPNVFSDVIVHGAFTSGTGVLALATSTGTTVLTAKQLRENYLLEITVNTGSTATCTLPATSTLLGLLDAGATRKWMIHNATTSAMTMTIGAGAGMDLIGVTVNDDVIDSTEYTELECTRQADTDWTCRISELLHVD